MCVKSERKSLVYFYVSLCGIWHVDLPVHFLYSRFYNSKATTSKLELVHSHRSDHEKLKSTSQIAG